MTRIQKLKRKGLSYRFGGILDCIDNKNLSEEEIRVLMSLKNDDRVIAGRKISSYAKACMDILGIQQVKDDIDAIELVKAMS